MCLKDLSVQKGFIESDMYHINEKVETNEKECRNWSQIPCVCIISLLVQQVISCVTMDNSVSWFPYLYYGE